MSLLTKGLSRVISSTTVQKHQFFSTQLSLWTNSHIHKTTGKAIALTILTIVSKVMSLIFNTLPTFVIAFLLRSKNLNFMAAVTVCSDFGAPKKKICHCFHISPFYLSWSDGAGWHALSFLNNVVSSQCFHSPVSPSSRGSLVPLHFLPLEWYHLHIWGCWNIWGLKMWIHPVVNVTNACCSSLETSFPYVRPVF